jgi:predicted DNA-binding protein (MmcQ/YjbR family)
MKPEDEHVINKLRQLCIRLPESYETRTFGHVTFRVKKKTFAVFEHYQGRPCITFKMTMKDQKDALDDSRFSIAPYVGKYGWVCRSTEDIDWNELAERLIDSYSLVAPKKLASTLNRDEMISTLLNLDL